MVLHSQQSSTKLILTQRSYLTSIVFASLLLISLTALIKSTVHASPFNPTDGTAIAYVSSSTGNQEIRMINPDGSDDRLLWRVPQEVHPNDGVGHSMLSWHPNATELAFDSGHDWERSLSIRDIYSVQPDGSNLRRLTRPPAPSEYGSFPTGQVKFTLDAIETGDVQVYVDGASEPSRYFSRLHDTWTFTFTVADFGEGVRQTIRLWDPEPLQGSCSYNEEAWVDVVPGQLTDFGTVRIDIWSDRQCPRMVSPSWNHDGSEILYSSNWIVGATNTANDLWRISAGAPNHTLGQQLLDADAHSSTERGLFGAVMNPTAARGEQMLYWSQSGFGSPVHLADINQPVPATLLTGCAVTFCHTRGLAWHPNGKEFFWAVHTESVTDQSHEDGGRLYRYDVDSQEITQILALPGEEIGKISPSPDGQTIAFERATLVYDQADYTQWGRRLLCPCEIWTVDVDGSNLRQLVADGHSPAWSPSAPRSGAQPVEAPQPTSVPTEAPTSVPTSVPPATPSAPSAPSGATENLPLRLWLPTIYQ